MGKRMGACVACLTMLMGACGGADEMPGQTGGGGPSMAPPGLLPDSSAAPGSGTAPLGSAGLMGVAGESMAPPAGGNPPPTPTPVTPTPATPMPTTPMPGLMPVTGGTPGGGGTGGGMATGMPPADGGGSDSGATTGGASDSGGTGMPAPPGEVDPIIPEIQGECPNFLSGSQRIMELQTEVAAGSPGATPGPLLFAWHGTGGTGSLGLLQVPASVKNDIMSQGGIVVAPTGGAPARSGQDVTFVLGVWYDGHDLDFADLIVACAVKNHNIDPRRIYTTGCSAGGLMAGTMALQRSSYVAAAAPNSGGVALPGGRPQDSARIPAIFAMHGGSGDNVIVNFQDTTNNLAAVLVPAGSFFVDCNHNSGHCGAPTSLHEAAWEFMKAHPFGTSPSPYAGGLPASFPSYCMVR